jgi:ABC-type spermidine/putrescine transport system permease subunit II
MKIKESPLSTAARSVEMVIKLAAILFLLVPAVVVIVLSFSNEKTMTFPPRTWGANQYQSLLGSDYWLSSIGTSFSVAIPSALLAVAVGVPAVLALERSRIKGKSVLRTLGVAPLVLPGVAYAVALYTFYIDAGLVGTKFGVILATSMLALPFVILVAGAGLRRIPADLELVAMSLGASRLRATSGITLRLLLPSIAAAAILAFVTTFDEAVLVNFLGGGQVITLPKAIYDSVRTGLEPLITAIATLLMLFTGVLMALVTRARKGDA